MEWFTFWSEISNIGRTKHQRVVSIKGNLFSYFRHYSYFTGLKIVISSCSVARERDTLSWGNFFHPHWELIYRLPSKNREYSHHRKLLQGHAFISDIALQLPQYYFLPLEQFLGHYFHFLDIPVSPRCQSFLIEPNESIFPASISIHLLKSVLTEPTAFNQFWPTQ